MSVAVLGPCRLARAGSDDDVPLTVLQARLLARLALAAPRSVPVEDLFDALWGDRQPATARAALQNQVSRLRAKAGATVVETTAAGYRLRVSTDVEVFAGRLAEAERELGPDGPVLRLERLRTAIALWRDRPYPEIDHLDEARAEATRLEAVYAAAETNRLAAAIDCGKLDWAVAEAGRLVTLDDQDERRWSLLITALDGVGRRGDALDAASRAHRVLRRRLGLDGGKLLRDAEADVLSGDGSPADDAGMPRVPGSRVLGRDEEIGRAVSQLEAGRSVLIEGEDGVGKSAVLNEVARRLRGEAVVARLQCPEFPEGATATLGELLEELGGELDRTVGPIKGFVDEVRRRATRDRVVLAVDDVHRVGPTIARVLDSCAAIDGVSVVATRLHEIPGSGDCLADATLVPLGPLPPAAVDDLVRTSPGGSVISESAVSWLSTMSGGNPLLLESLMADGLPAELQRGEVEPGAGDGRPNLAIESSSALAALVRQRLGRLGVATQRAIEVASVCGREFPTDLLVDLVGTVGLAGAQASGLLAIDGDVARFRHGAVQRLVSADLAPGRRVEIHYAVGLLRLQRGDPAAVAAPHLLAAMELDPALAVATARSAGEDAASDGAHQDAATWHGEAVAAARAMGPSGTRDLVLSMVRQGDELRLAGAPAHEPILFEAASLAEEIDDAELMAAAAYALLQLGSTTESGGLNDRAVALADRVLARIEDPGPRAVVTAAASLAYSMSGHPDRCRALFVEAERAARSDETRRKVLPFTYMALGHPDDLEDRERLARELLDRSTRAGDEVAAFEAQHLLFSVGLQRGDGPAVRGALVRAGELVEQVGDVGRRWSLVYMSAAVAHLDDRLDESERLAEQALDLFGPVSPSRAFAVYGAQLLALRLAQGQVDEMAPVFDQLVQDQPGVPAWHSALALAIVDESPSRAARHARHGLEDAPSDFTWLAAHVVGGRAAARGSDRDTTRAYLERLDPYLDLVCWQGSCAYGPVATTAALLATSLGEHRKAAEHVATARRLAERLDAPVFLRELEALGTGS